MSYNENEVKVELDLGEPPQCVLDYAREHWGETPETRLQALEDFRDYIFEKEECNPHRTDNSFLLRFLRARKFNIPQAHRLLCRYYGFKEKNPHLHRDIRPMDLKVIGDDGVISVPPYRDQNGRRLVIYRAAGWNPNNYSIDDIFKATVITLELGILEQRAQILGGLCILDLKGLRLQHTWQVTPPMAIKMVEFVAGSLVMKIESIHILHQSWMFDIIFNIFKPLLNQKMKDKIFFHGDDFESLHAHIDPKYLPVRYGGTQDDCNHNLWLEWFKTKRDIVEELRILGYIFDERDTAFDDFQPNNKQISDNSNKNIYTDDDDDSDDSDLFSDCQTE